MSEEAKTNSNEDLKEKGNLRKKNYVITNFAKKMRDRRNQEKLKKLDKKDVTTCKSVSVDVTRMSSHSVPKITNSVKTKKRKYPWNKGIMKKRKITKIIKSNNGESSEVENSKPSEQKDQNNELELLVTTKNTTPKKLANSSILLTDEKVNDTKLNETEISRRVLPMVGKLNTKELRDSFMKKFIKDNQEEPTKKDEKVPEQNQNNISTTNGITDESTEKTKVLRNTEKLQTIDDSDIDKNKFVKNMKKSKEITKISENSEKLQDVSQSDFNKNKTNELIGRKKSKENAKVSEHSEIFKEAENSNINKTENKKLEKKINNQSKHIDTALTDSETNKPKKDLITKDNSKDTEMACKVSTSKKTTQKFQSGIIEISLDSDDGPASKEEFSKNKDSKMNSLTGHTNATNEDAASNSSGDKNGDPNPSTKKEIKSSATETESETSARTVVYYGKSTNCSRTELFLRKSPCRRIWLMKNNFEEKKEVITAPSTESDTVETKKEKIQKIDPVNKLNETYVNKLNSNSESESKNKSNSNIESESTKESSSNSTSAGPIHNGKRKLSVALGNENQVKTCI